MLGVLNVSQAAVQHLGEGASIINVSSVVTDVLPPNSAVYTGSKGAVDAITGVLANELGARKIRVNAVSPGIVETEGSQTAGFIGSDFEKGVVAQTPLGRTGRPDDIAKVVVFLASDDFGLGDRRALRRQRRPALSSRQPPSGVAWRRTAVPPNPAWPLGGKANPSPVLAGAAPLSVDPPITSS